MDDPDVQAARTAIDSLRKALSAVFKRSEEQLAQLGNVQKRLATLEANAQKYAVPQLLKVLFGEADAKAWVTAASSARTVGEHNQKELATIAPIAYLPNNPGTPQGGAPYDANDVSRLQYNAAGMLKGVVSGYESMEQELKNRLAQIESDVLSRWQENPESDQRWFVYW